MGRFFNVDNPLFVAIGKIFDYVFLSFLFITFSIPVITIGASWTATYYTYNKTLRRDRGYIFSNFWHSFTSNFKQSTLIWLIVMLVYGIIYADIKVVEQFNTTWKDWAKLFFTACGLFWTFIVIYLFPYLARFEQTTKRLIKNCIYISMTHIHKTIPMALIVIMGATLIYILPITMFVVPGVAIALLAIMMEKIFIKYMTPEDREIEEVLNAE